MYREGELVEVKEHKLRSPPAAGGNQWDVVWLPAVVVQWHGKMKMRTGIARFEEREVVSVLIEGKVRKVPARNIRYPRE